MAACWAPVWARGCSPARRFPKPRTEQTVGPAGGTILVGPHRLVIPAGALTSPVLITAEAPADSVNSVRLLPHGLTFAPGKPAKLTLSYANCSLLGQLLPKRIVYTTDLLEILEWLLSADEPLARRVSTSLEHFSRYAIAWQRNQVWTPGSSRARAVEARARARPQRAQ